LMGSLYLTGIGLTLSSGIVHIGGGNTFVALLLAAIASFVLGMGMTSIPCYIMLAIFVKIA